MPKETGIIMSGSHPVDILEGRKTMTRRTWGLEKINKNPDDWRLVAVFQDGLARFCTHDGSQELTLKCPYGGYGDRLWVKETYTSHCEIEKYRYLTFYDSAESVRMYEGLIPKHIKDGKHPSIFMTRWASRILLEITELRAERLQEISEDDAMAEGRKNTVLSDMYPDFNIALKPASHNFKELWDSLNAKRGYGWEKNNWVWPIRFRMIKQ